jgi:hypothetical protein
VRTLLGQQDDRHGLGMNRFDDSVRPLELSPDARKAGQRPIGIEGEPDDILLFGLGSALAHIQQSY